MNLLNLRFGATMAAMAWLALAGVCGPAVADGVPAARAARHATVPRTDPMTVAVRKSNDSGVTIQYRVDGAGRIGRPVSVVLEFDGVTDPSGATVRMTTDASLTLTTSASLLLPAGQRTSATATVTSSSEGLAYLNVFVRQNGAMSIVAIPVQTGAGSAAMKPLGEMKSSPEGEKIISMPAKEPLKESVKEPAKEPKTPSK